MKRCAKQLLVWDKPLNYIDVTFNAYAGQTSVASQSFFELRNTM